MELTHVQKVRKLYKVILKLHKGLPEELQSLGDTFVKEEFKRHKKCTPREAEIFIKEWTSYALELSRQLDSKGGFHRPLGKDIKEKDLESFSSNQILQLYELRKAIYGDSDEKN